MARNRRGRVRARTAEHHGVRRAELIIDADAFASARDDLRRWTERLDAYPPSSPRAAPSTMSIVLDDVDLVLFAGEAEITGEHEGGEFVDLAVADGVVVLISAGVDVRPARPADLDGAARHGDLRAARVAAFRVDTL